MIDVIEYYFENFPINPNSSYDYAYFNDIEKYPKNWIMLQKELICYDDKQIINEWRNLLYPSNDRLVVEGIYKNSKYYFLSFFLMNEKYVITEFPTELENSKGLSNFTDNILYQETALKFGRDDRGAVKWSNRRILIDSLTIKKTVMAIDVTSKIETLIKVISTRGAEFTAMSMDEKLQNIRDAYEHLVSLQGGYDSINYEELFMGYITEANLREYSRKLHCFRHGKLEALSERTSLTEEQKTYMINFGIVVINRINNLS
ncbi:MAG: hypothetical protein NUK62_06655 [Tenericutes bacterium]|nr:hypothetical protein [Mycoplasmatota bacterium]